MNSYEKKGAETGLGRERSQTVKPQATQWGALYHLLPVRVYLVGPKLLGLYSPTLSVT